MPTAHQLLSDLCVHLKLQVPPAPVEGEAVVGIDFGEDLLVFISADEPWLTVYSRLGVLGADQTDLLEQLFDANLFWQGTGAATLAFERFSRSVVLQQRALAEALDMRALEELVKDFAQEAERWIQVIETVGKADDPLAAPAYAQIV